MSNATFTDVSGQTVTVGRPPADYVVVVDTDGTFRHVAAELLRSVGPMGELVLGGLNVKGGDPNRREDAP